MENKIEKLKELQFELYVAKQLEDTNKIIEIEKKLKKVRRII